MWVPGGKPILGLSLFDKYVPMTSYLLKHTLQHSTPEGQTPSLQAGRGVVR